jgi:hypothetical protein
MTTILTAGTKIQGSYGTFTLVKVTNSRVSWFTSSSFKGGNGINTMKMTWASVKQANEWIEKGLWKIV